MTVKTFLHAALIVSNLEAAEAFYGGLLGLPVAKRNLKFPGIWYQVGDCQIHLILQPQVPGDRVDESKWGRNRHLALAVADLETVKADLTRAGYTFQMSASGRAALFVPDPDGNLIELQQQP